MCAEKASEGIYGINLKTCIYCLLCFLFIYLFVCLFNNSLHFYICNVLFVLPNNGIFFDYYFKVYSNISTCKYAQIL